MEPLITIAGLIAFTSPGAIMAAADPDSYMPVELIAETDAPKPGSTVLLGFKMNPKPGWHGYWSNPGDAGIVPTVRWSAPSAVTFGPLLHPAPTLISDSGIHSFVHEGKHVLLTRMKVPASIKPGTSLPVQARLDWAACTATQCVPLSASFSLDLSAGTGSRSADFAILHSARRRLPRKAPKATCAVSDDIIRLHLPADLGLNAKSTRFFPDDNLAFPTADARAFTGNGRTVIEARTESATPKTLTGVVADGRSAFRIRCVQGEAPAPQEEEPTPAKLEPDPQFAAEPGNRQPQSASRPAENQSPIPWRWIAFAGALALAAGAIAFAKRV